MLQPTSQFRDRIRSTMWEIWEGILNIIVFAIAVTIYTPRRPRTRKDRRDPAIVTRSIKVIHDVAHFTACKLGDWIEKNVTLKRNISRRRIKLAIGRHRKRMGHAGLIAMSVLAMNARTAIATERTSQFDTDSDMIGVDNRCSGCISHVKEDFVGELRPSNRIVKGFGGTRTTNVKIGTLRWSWEDDQGRKHTFDIPHSYYIPQGKVRLLSPQHWAQSQNGKNVKRRNECGERTNGTECVLFWNGGEHSLSIPFGRRDNVATFPMAHGFKQFVAFCSEAGLDGYDKDPMAMPSGIISDDEESEQGTNDIDMTDDAAQREIWTPPPEVTVENQRTPAMNFDLNGPAPTPATTLTEKASEEVTMVPLPNVIIDEETRQPEDAMAQLLMTHYQYGHAPMRKLQAMAEQGIIPKRLARCRIPVCSACLYAKATRKPWRGKTRKNEENDEGPTAPGHVVSVDQLVSPTPGLIAQMTGFLTTKRYKYATVYVDQFSRFGYVHLQKTATAEETVEGKRAFECFAKRNGVRVENYHADNGIFKARLWTEACA